MDANGFSSRHDIIVVYSKSDSWRPNRIEQVDLPEYYKLTDELGRTYTRAQLRKGGGSSRREDRPNMFFPILAPDGTEVFPLRDDGTEGRWRWSQARVTELYEELEWVQGRRGWNPYTRIYAENIMAKPPETIWLRDFVGTNTIAKKEIKVLFPGETPFDTPKPEKLLAQIMTLASEPGDVVLDVFGGSGSTGAVATKLRRRWVLAEILPETVRKFTQPRISKVVRGEDAGGVTADVDWSGGSGFRTLEIQESFYAMTPLGVMLTDDANGPRFARAVAGQLGFDWESANGLLCARRGRMRLAVLDGAVGVEETRQIVSELEENERATIVARVILPGAEEWLSENSRGSICLKAPNDVLRERRKRRRSNGGDA
jgi:adenine-specific DNA-methyltransferase